MDIKACESAIVMIYSGDHGKLGVFAGLMEVKAMGFGC